MKAAELHTKVLSMAEEQTKVINQINQTQIKQGIVLEQALEMTQKNADQLQLLKDEFVAHRHDSVTWSRLGKMFTYLSVGSGMFTALGKIFGWY